MAVKDIKFIFGFCHSMTITEATHSNGKDIVDGFCCGKKSIYLNTYSE